MVSLQPPAAGGVVAPSSGRGVLKADPTDPGTAGLSRSRLPSQPKFFTASFPKIEPLYHHQEGRFYASEWAR